MIRISQLKLSPEHSREDLVQKAAKTLHISEKEIKSLDIRKQSIDARKKPNIQYVYTVDIKVSNEQKVMRRQKGSQVTLYRKNRINFLWQERKKWNSVPLS